MSIRTEDTRSGAFVLHSTCFFGHRRNGERGNLFLQTSGFHARSEVGSLIQHHTLLAEMLIDLLPFLLSHTMRARSSQHHAVHSPAEIDLAITESHITPDFKLIVSPQVSFFISLVQTLCVQSFLCCTSPSRLFSIFLFPKMERLKNFSSYVYINRSRP